MANRKIIFKISKSHEISENSSGFDLENTYFHWINQKLWIVPTNQTITNLDRDEVDKVLLAYIRDNNQLLADEK